MFAILFTLTVAENFEIHILYCSFHYKFVKGFLAITFLLLVISS